MLCLFSCVFRFVFVSFCFNLLKRVVCVVCRVLCASFLVYSVEHRLSCVVLDLGFFGFVILLLIMFVMCLSLFVMCLCLLLCSGFFSCVCAF